MISSQKLKFNAYRVLCYMVFALISLLTAERLNTVDWPFICLAGALATYFDLKSIKLPSGEDLSMVASLLFLAGVTHGVSSVMLVTIVMAILLIIYHRDRPDIVIFNICQYAISAATATWVFEAVGGQIGQVVHFTRIVPYLVFITTYFFCNVFLVCLYVQLQGKTTLRQMLKNLLEPQSVLIYFVTVCFGVFMTIIYQQEGIAGMVACSVVLAVLGLTFQRYYDLFDHFRSLSVYDELTGIHNHRYFQETLKDLIRNETPVSLALIDLDFFKIYNDLFGHLKGDELLREIAQLLKHYAPKDSVTCRYGGEEFAIIMPNRNVDESVETMERIRKALSEHPFYGAEHMPKKCITVSIGIASYPDMAGDKEKLIQLADEALYKVKYTSKNRVQVYSSVIDDILLHEHFEACDVEVVQSIKTFLSIIHSKDRYTYGHTERTMHYAEALARKVGLTDEEVRIVRYGALLHDIGKVEIPAHILTKASTLTDEEWDTVRKHTILGEEIVRPIRQFAPCLPIIRSHHERIDGKGYPDGLAGDEIPRIVRIITIAESFDAMTTNRPYQKSKSHEEALAELRRCAGTQFDPALVEVFCEVVQNELFAYQGA
jgi:diguanylate cyclase (GGDEF)-like protein/putative nucleotidyltransferase with HDIG domain